MSLTPQQAASGAVVTVPLPSGATRVRVPPVRDGDVVRIRVGETEVLLRIRVTSPATPSRGLQGLGVLAVAAVLVFLVVLANGGDGSDSDNASGVDTTSSPYAEEPYSEDPYTADPYTADPYTADPYTEDPYSDEPYSEDPYTEDPYGTESAAPDPYESGTCLNGTLPDSSTAQEVSGVDEVSCSASDAHYKVIETIPLTSELSRCNANPRTEYAFSYSYTRNGIPLYEYVYCLVGLGSYG
ncbi:hypothetical protein [Streptomyces sp. NBC_00038]|uniref:LppU/SCO3897 family protein n=1 Tax=Streptomyces sp. NBC_00038 TaxID=2903615 RepID=UPI002258FD51|nr:hypothetical protein [Streptomyces sp. NBC_00038]MCX5559788.1 hypothetical protein [Streptomyces sp. NBC_00038]